MVTNCVLTMSINLQHLDLLSVQTLWSEMSGFTNIVHKIKNWSTLSTMSNLPIPRPGLVGLEERSDADKKMFIAHTHTHKHTHLISRTHSLSLSDFYFILSFSFTYCKQYLPTVKFKYLSLKPVTVCTTCFDLDLKLIYNFLINTGFGGWCYLLLLLCCVLLHPELRAWRSLTHMNSQYGLQSPTQVFQCNCFLKIAIILVHNIRFLCNE